MDKYEYKVRSEEISELIEKEKYAEAVKIADTIDWRRVKSATMLLKIAALYRVSRRNEDSREMLLLAYERYPTNRSVVYSLCELSIELDDVVAAIEYYKKFVKLAPKDNGVYTLRYRILEAQEASLEERIEILEELKKKDYQEEWAYELAYLYHRVGLSTKCVEECDDIILWFGDGAYVMKAMELKAKHVPLTDEQLQNYNIMLGNAGQNYSSGNYDAGNYDAGDYNAGDYADQNYDPGYGGEGYDSQNYDPGYGGEGYDSQNYDPGYGGEGYDGQNYDPGYGGEGYDSQNYDPGYGGEGYDNQNYDSGYNGEGYDGQNYDPGYNGESYDNQNYDPDYGGEGYADQNYDSGYSSESYDGQNYTGEGYDDQSYTAEGYNDDNYAGQGYSTGNYETQGYTADDGSNFYADGQENYSEQQYAQNNYVDDGYGNLSYVDSGYQDNGYTGQFYVEQAYDENGNLIDPDRYTDNYPYSQNAQSQDTGYTGQNKEYRNGLHLVESPAAPAANSGDMSQYNTINLQKVVAESMKELFPDDNEDVFAEDREKYNSGETVRDKSGDTRIFAGMKEQPASAQTTGRVNIAQMVTGVSEAAPEPHTGAIKKVFIPGGDARPIKSDSDMEELRDTTEQSVEDEHERMESNDENVYHEKSLLSTEEEEKAPTGPMKLDKVLVEWERMKQDNAKKNQEQIKKRVMTQTGKLFADFDNSIKSGILGELEREEAEAERKNQKSTVKKRKDGFLDADITGDIPQQPASDDDFDVSYVTEQKHPAKSQEISKSEGESDRANNKEDDPGNKALAENEELHENISEDIKQEYLENSDIFTEQGHVEGTGAYVEQGYAEGTDVYVEQGYAEGTDEDTKQEYSEDANIYTEQGYSKDIGEDTDAYTGQEYSESTDAYMKDERSEGTNAYTGQKSFEGTSEYPKQEHLQEMATYTEQPAVEDSDTYIDEMNRNNADAYTEDAGTDHEELYAGDSGQRTEEIDIQNVNVQDAEMYTGANYPYVEDAEEYPDQDYEKDAIYTDPAYTQQLFNEGLEEGMESSIEEPYDMPYTEEEEYSQEDADAYADEYYEEDTYEDLEDAYSDTYEDSSYAGRRQNDQYNERALDPEDAESIAEMAKEDALKTQEIKMNTADLSSLSEKIVATTKKEANGAKREEIRDFTSEEQALFENFAVTKKIKKQIIYALENMTLAAYTGNVILTGDAGLDTIRMAKNLIKEYQAADENFSGKLAKITGEKINQRNIKDIFEKLSNGGIIIEKANGMTEEKLYELAINLNQDTLGIVVIMEDTKKEITKLLEKQAMIVDYFNIRIDLMEMDNNALVAYAKNYALALEYSIDELGTLALYTRIANMQSGNHVVTKDEVRDIIDEAIWKSKKSKIKNFVDVLFARRYDDEDMIVLKERDFM